MIFSSQDEVLVLIDAMRAREDSNYALERYELLPLSDEAQSGELDDFTDEPSDPMCRSKMFDWALTVVQHCGFSRDNVATAFALLDRYLSTPQGKKGLADRKQFQLSCMTAIYLSLKINEVEALTPRGMATVSRGEYSEQDITECERDILMALKWYVNPPTPTAFAKLYVSLVLPEKERNLEDSRQASTEALRKNVNSYVALQIDMATRDYNFVGVKSSDIALASILNALSCFAEDASMVFQFDSQIRRLREKISISQETVIRALQNELFRLSAEFTNDLQQDSTSLTTRSTCSDNQAEADASINDQSFESIDDVTKIDTLSPKSAISPKCIAKEQSNALKSKHPIGHFLCGILEPLRLLQEQ